MRRLGPSVSRAGVRLPPPNALERMSHTRKHPAASPDPGPLRRPPIASSKNRAAGAASVDVRLIKGRAGNGIASERPGCARCGAYPARPKVLAAGMVRPGGGARWLPWSARADAATSCAIEAGKWSPDESPARLTGPGWTGDGYRRTSIPTAADVRFASSSTVDHHRPPPRTPRLPRRRACEVMRDEEEGEPVSPTSGSCASSYNEARSA